MDIYGTRCSWNQFKYDKFGAQWIPIIYRHVCDNLNKGPNDSKMMTGWFEGSLYGYYYANIDRVSIDVEIANRRYNKSIFNVSLFHKRVKCLDMGYYKAQNIKLDIIGSMTCDTRIKSMKVKLGLKRVVNFKRTD